jgi:hypothetical protein
MNKLERAESGIVAALAALTSVGAKGGRITVEAPAESPLGSFALVHGKTDHYVQRGVDTIIRPVANCTESIGSPGFELFIEITA